MVQFALSWFETANKMTALQSQNIANLFDPSRVYSRLSVSELRHIIHKYGKEGTDVDSLEIMELVSSCAQLCPVKYSGLTKALCTAFKADLFLQIDGVYDYVLSRDEAAVFWEICTKTSLPPDCPQVYLGLPVKVVFSCRREQLGPQIGPLYSSVDPEAAGSVGYQQRMGAVILNSKSERVAQVTGVGPSDLGEATFDVPQQPSNTSLVPDELGEGDELARGETTFTAELRGTIVGAPPSV